MVLLSYFDTIQDKVVKRVYNIQKYQSPLKTKYTTQFLGFDVLSFGQLMFIQNHLKGKGKTSERWTVPISMDYTLTSSRALNSLFF